MKQHTVAQRGYGTRKDEIAGVALDLFSERGYSAVTIKDITRVVGINPALVYYYFKGKEDLFRASIEYAVALAYRNHLHLRTRHDDPIARIEAWFVNNLQMAAPIRKLMKIMLDYAGSSARVPGIDAAIADFYQYECTILTESVQRGIADGVFDPALPADRLALFVSTHLDGLMVASVIRKNFDLASAMSDLKTVLWRHLGMEAVVRPGAESSAQGAGKLSSAIISAPLRAQYE